MHNLRFGPRVTPGVKTLILINVVVYILTLIINFRLDHSHSIMQNHIFAFFNLTPQHVLEGDLWRLFTYQFLHGGIWHLAFNMLVVWMFGSELEEKWSTKFFVRYYFICALGAGIFIFVIPIILEQSLIVPTVGASGAGFGLLLAYAIYWPDRKVLVWFIIPVKIKYLVLIMGLFSLFFTFQTTGGGGISHVGHLGGLITGYIYLMYKLHYLVQSMPPSSPFKPNIFKNLFAKYKENRKKKEWQEKQQDIYDQMHMEEKVDTLLEKISKEGWKSLSTKERQFLKKASEQMEGEKKVPPLQ